MDKATARQVSALLEAAIAKLSETLEVAERSVPPDEYDTLKRGAGIVMGHISYELLDPIYRQIPDLAPRASSEMAEASSAEPPNRPFERPGMNAQRADERAWAGRSTPLSSVTQ